LSVEKVGVNFEARFKTKVKGSGEGMSHLLSGCGQEEESQEMYFGKFYSIVCPLYRTHKLSLFEEQIRQR